MNRPTTRVCPFEHDHPASDWSYDDCVAAYNDLKAKRDAATQRPPRAQAPMLIVGHRYRVVFREQGKRVNRDMLADFVSSTETYSFWSGRPDFGTVQIAFADVIEVGEVSRQTNKVRRPRPVRAS